MKKQPQIESTEIIEDQGHNWLLAKFKDYPDTTFTLDNGGDSIHLLNPDGSALQDSEMDFQKEFEEEEWYKTFFGELI